MAEGARQRNRSRRGPVWAITTYRRTPDRQLGNRVVRNRRTVGLFPTQEEALTIVEGNYGDLEEAGWYQYAVVEPIAFGLYPINDAAERVWYEFCRPADPPETDQTNTGRWVKLTQCPEVIWKELGLDKERVTNWSEIG